MADLSPTPVQNEEDVFEEESMPYGGESTKKKEIMSQPEEKKTPPPLTRTVEEQHHSKGNTFSLILKYVMPILVGVWLLTSIILTLLIKTPSVGLISAFLALKCGIYGILIKWYNFFFTFTNYSTADTHLYSWNITFITGMALGFITLILNLPLLWFFSIFGLIVIGLLMLVFKINFYKALGIYVVFAILDLVMDLLMFFLASAL